MNYLKELEMNELKKISGGENLVEYVAYGLGYVARLWVKHSVSSSIVVQSSAV